MSRLTSTAPAVSPAPPPRRDLPRRPVPGRRPARPSHRRLPADADVPRGRALHLVDIENLAGSARPEPTDALAVVSEYLDLARWNAGDHVVVSANGALLRTVMFALPAGWAVRGARRGPDGADHVLLDAAEPDFVVARFHRLVVGSGDGIFASLLATVGAAGVFTSVVSARPRLSTRLRVAAGHVRYLSGAPLREAS